MGMAFSRNEKWLVRLPSAVSLREAKVNVLGIGPLHDFLEKGFK
jgi:hypothetical protein